MRSRMIFYAISSLVGVLYGTQHFRLIPLLFCLYFLFLWQRKKFSKIQLLLVLFTFLIFYMKADIENKTNITSFTGSETNFLIYIDDQGKFDGDSLTIAAKHRNTKEKLLIKYKIKTEEEKRNLKQNLSPGQLCNVKGILEEPSIATNENLFNYNAYLYRNNIHWILQTDNLSLQNCQSSPNLLHSIKKIRFQGINYIERNFPKETIPFAAALLFGTSDLLSSNVIDDYRELGIVHILAISGLHITIIVAIIYLLLLRLGLTREKSMTFLLICLPVYSILAGGTPSVIRSVLMTILLLISKRWSDKFPLKAVDAISLTFIIYVFFSPNAIYHIGFQLSFLVTFTLLISSSFLLKRYTHPVTLLLVTSVLSTICSAPLLLYSFFEFSFISLVVNLIYIPFFNLLILPFLIFVFILHLIFGDIIYPLQYLLNEIISFTNALTEKIAEFPWNTMTLGRPSIFYCFLYAGGIYLFFSLWEKGRDKIRIIGLILLPCCLFAGQYIFQNFSSEGEITFIDVGQGDSIYIRLPYGRGNYLIDTGGNTQWMELNDWQKKDHPFDVGRDTVAPFLKSKGVTSLDKLIITHGDVDHAGGAFALFEEIKIKELILPDRMKLSELEKELVIKARSSGTGVRFVHAGESWETKKERFFILGPKEKSNMESNNASVILYTKLGGMSWLFTGDLEKEGEKELITEYPNLTVDVLKAGHHGSKSSTTEQFLEQITPKIAVISVGEGNRFQHPHTEVLNRLMEKNIYVVRSDVSGAINYSFYKETGTFSVQNP